MAAVHTLWRVHRHHEVCTATSPGGSGASSARDEHPPAGAGEPGQHPLPDGGPAGRDDDAGVGEPAGRELVAATQPVQEAQAPTGDTSAIPVPGVEQ